MHQKYPTGTVPLGEFPQGDCPCGVLLIIVIYYYFSACFFMYNPIEFIYDYVRMILLGFGVL